MTKAEEERFLHRLKQFQVFADFDKIKASESPDFICYLGEKKIGLELTEAFNDDLGSGSPRRKLISFKEQLGDLVVQKLSLIRPCFHLGLRFSDYLKLGKYEMEDYAERVADFLRPIITLKKDSIGFEIKYDNHPFDEIDDIHCIFHDSLKESYYSGSDAVFVPHFEDEHLEVILSRKESKLPKYKECDEHWLVIREGNLTAGMFDEIRINSFRTSFHRVFMYRIVGSKLLELHKN